MMKNPFIGLPQSVSMSHVIIMRHWVFRKLAEELGDPKHNEVEYLSVK